MTMLEQMMERYHARYHEIIASDIDIIRAMNSHVDMGEGKQLRPELTFLMALCCGLRDNDNNLHKLYSVAAAIELLHNSSLVHDDVIDESDTRRGIATVNHNWDNKKAVLYGDYLLAKVMHTIHEVDNPRITAIVTDTAMAMSCGELLQQQCCGNYDTSISTCLKVIEMKTARFLSSCCEVGAVLASSDEETITQAQRFGLNIGMAFQLRDDMRDFLPCQLTGKPQGNDLREHKSTIPVIFTLENTDNQAYKEKLLALLSKPLLTDNEISSITNIVVESSGWQKTKTLFNDYMSKAGQHLMMLPDNKYKNSLEKVLDNLKEN